MGLNAPCYLVLSLVAGIATKELALLFIDCYRSPDFTDCKLKPGAPEEFIVAFAKEFPFKEPLMFVLNLLF